MVLSITGTWSVKAEILGLSKYLRMTTMPSLKNFYESKWYKTLKLTVEFSEANISYNNKRLRDYISPYSKVKMGFIDNRKALPDLQLKNFDPYSSPRDDKSSV